VGFLNRRVVAQGARILAAVGAPDEELLHRDLVSEVSEVVHPRGTRDRRLDVLASDCGLYFLAIGGGPLLMSASWDLVAYAKSAPALERLWIMAHDLEVIELSFPMGDGGLSLQLNLGCPCPTC